MPQVIKAEENQGVQNDEIKVATVQFAYDNRELILKLKQRG